MVFRIFGSVNYFKGQVFTIEYPETLQHND